MGRCLSLSLAALLGALLGLDLPWRAWVTGPGAGVRLGWEGGSARCGHPGLGSEQRGLRPAFHAFPRGPGSAATWLLRAPPLP